MDTAKAVVLARGLGTRMREGDASVSVSAGQADAAAQGLKAMMPVSLRPVGAIAGPGVAPASAAPPVSSVSPTATAVAATAARDTDREADRAANRDAAAAADAAPRERPFLDYILSALADAGYTDVCLVVAPDHDRIRDYYTREAPPRRVRVTFAVQAEPRGTADALLAAEAFAGADDVLVINGDNYYPVAALRALRELAAPGTVLFEPDGLVRRGNIAPDRLRAFATGLVDAAGWLTDIVEKPDAATARALGDAAPISMNCWRLPPAILACCRQVAPSPRGELELTAAIRDALRTRQIALRVLRSDAGVLDLSRRGDIATVAAHLAGLAVQP